MACKSAMFFAVVYILTFSVRQCYSLECYECIDCGDPFDSSAHAGEKIDCTGSCQKVKINDFAARNCFPLLKSDSCEQENNNAACQCTTDLCNSASMTKTSGVFLLSLAAVFFSSNICV